MVVKSRLKIDLPFEASEAKKRKIGLREGLGVLPGLWRRGQMPRDLKFHYWTTWFARSNGNAAAMARLCGLHRNQVLHVAGILTGTPKTLKLRVKWASIRRFQARKGFPGQVGLFSRP